VSKELWFVFIEVGLMIADISQLALRSKATNVEPTELSPGPVEPGCFIGINSNRRFAIAL
jgi:hypothetical protein